MTDQSGFYQSFLDLYAQGTVGLDGDTLRVMLLRPTYRPQLQSHSRVSDIAARECRGDGYRKGGKTLEGFRVAREGNRRVFYASDVIWPECDLVARYAVLYVAGDSNDLMCCLDFGADKAAQHGGDFTLSWPEGGIFSVSIQQ